MKKAWLLCSFAALALLLAAVGFALAQGDSPPARSFALVREIGLDRPFGLHYDPHFDRLVMVDPLGRLLLVDAATLETQHVLYEQGTYSAYRFSHDGRWLALAIDRRVELWDTQTGQIDTDIEVENAVALQGPLQFASDDSLLLINAIVPAPATLRRSENDTVNEPYLWDLVAARTTTPSILPGNFELYAFYDYRFGFLLGPRQKAIGALPERLRLIDVADRDLPVLQEIPADRNERDPIRVWYSLRGDSIYVLPQGRNDLVQLDTASGAQTVLPLSRGLSYRELKALDTLVLNGTARLIGEPHSRTTNSLLRLLLGEEYPLDWNYHPLTVFLIDILDPQTVEAGPTALVLYVMDNETGSGTVEFVSPPDALRLALHPEGTHLLVRRASGAQPIEVYNLDSGALDQTLYPALRDPDGSHLLAYNGTGEIILCDFQRFDARTGDVLSENLSYVESLGQMFFTGDSRRLVTLTGEDWWVWDIETGEVIRRERVILRGPLLDVSPDGSRFLVEVTTGQGRGIEIVEVGTGQRPSLFFEALPDREIVNVFPSPDWQNFLVVYSRNPFGPHFPGAEIALYNLNEGKQWYLAGDDLPYPEASGYGWADNETFYIYGENQGAGLAPRRIYGIDYHASGLPACLVEAFPDRWPGWLDLWERLNAHLAGDELDTLAQTLCAALPAPLEEIDAILYPTATATLPAVTATPAAIAGVPACLSARFPQEAVDYAAVWRDISAGLPPDQAAALEELLCTGLSRVSVAESSLETSAAPVDNVQVMTFNIRTGARAFGGTVPGASRPLERLISLVLEELERDENLPVQGALLSPDGTLLAVQLGANRINLYRLLKPYEAMVSDATATAAPFITEEARVISVRPTDTPPFIPAGGPRPTLTPTITPTAPPRPVEVASQSQYGQVEELCSTSDTLFTAADPPPGYSPSGYLLASSERGFYPWVLEPASGDYWPEPRLPGCGIERECQSSFDGNWITWFDDDGSYIVSRADGSDATLLYTAAEAAAAPESFYWQNLHTLQYEYRTYVEGRRDPVLQLRRFDPATGVESNPFGRWPGIQINELTTEVVASQPDNGPLALVQTNFNTGHSTGAKYYIYDRNTNTAVYFARLAEYSSNTLEAQWHPLGTALYYRYPDSPDWYLFDPATREHRWLGRLPGGTWSREARYRADWFSLPPEEEQDRREAGQPLPRVQVWDSDTGLLRRYCLPFESSYGSLIWSPDSRYLAFREWLPVNSNPDLGAREHVLVLDLLTGSVTDLGFELTQINAWSSSVPERP